MSRKSKYPPYEQAKKMALELHLNSRSDYIKWHTDTKCEYLPRYPERAYADKGWESWNEWLGTANVFLGNVQAPVRPFWEAVKWSQEHCLLHDLNTMNEWLSYWEEHKDELPSDIPLRPDQRYVEWQQLGWKGWLGTDVRGKLAAAKQSTALFAICSFHSLSKPGNVYAIVNAEKGEVELLSILARARELVPVRVYKMINDEKETVMNLVNKFRRDNKDDVFIPRDDGRGIFIPDIGELLFELDMILTPHLLRSIPEPPEEEITDDMLFPPSVYKKRVW